MQGVWLSLWKNIVFNECEPTVPVNAEEVNITLSMLSSSFSDSFHFQFERIYSQPFHVFQPKEATVVDK